MAPPWGQRRWALVVALLAVMVCAALLPTCIAHQSPSLQTQQAPGHVEKETITTLDVGVHAKSNPTNKHKSKPTKERKSKRTYMRRSKRTKKRRSKPTKKRKRKPTKKSKWKPTESPCPDATPCESCSSRCMSRGTPGMQLRFCKTREDYFRNAVSNAAPQYEDYSTIVNEAVGYQRDPNRALCKQHLCKRWCDKRVVNMVPLHVSTSQGHRYEASLDRDIAGAVRVGAEFKELFDKTFMPRLGDYRKPAYFRKAMIAKNICFQTLKNALLIREKHNRMRTLLQSTEYRKRQFEVMRFKYAALDFQDRLRFWERLNDTLTKAVHTSSIAIKQVRVSLETEMTSFAVDAQISKSLNQTCTSTEDKYKTLHDMRDKLVTERDMLQINTERAQNDITFVKTAAVEITTLLQTMLRKIEDGSIHIGCGKSVLVEAISAVVSQGSPET